MLCDYALLYVFQRRRLAFWALWAASCGERKARETVASRFQDRELEFREIDCLKFQVVPKSCTISDAENGCRPKARGICSFAAGPARLLFAELTRHEPTA